MNQSDNRPATERTDGFQAYYDASQLRLDAWTELKELTNRNERRERSGRDSADLREGITRTLATLAQIEAYFAFPGPEVVEQLRSLFKRGHYGTQARQTERVVRLLAGGLYRLRDVSHILHEDFDGTDSSTEAFEHLGASGSRPYFEVLVIDDIGGGQIARDIRVRANASSSSMSGLAGMLSV